MNLVICKLLVYCCWIKGNIWTDDELENWIVFIPNCVVWLVVMWKILVNSISCSKNRNCQCQEINYLLQIKWNICWFIAYCYTGSWNTYFWESLSKTQEIFFWSSDPGQSRFLGSWVFPPFREDNTVCQ